MELLAVIVALTTTLLIVPGTYLLLGAVILIEQRHHETDQPRTNHSPVDQRARLPRADRPPRSSFRAGRAG